MASEAQGEETGLVFPPDGPVCRKAAVWRRYGDVVHANQCDIMDGTYSAGCVCALDPWNIPPSDDPDADAVCG